MEEIVRAFRWHGNLAGLDGQINVGNMQRQVPSRSDSPGVGGECDDRDSRLRAVRGGTMDQVVTALRVSQEA